MKKTIILVISLVIVLASTAYLTNPGDIFGTYNWEDRPQEPPELRVFQTDYNEGTQVVFSHKLHARDLEIGCNSCHHLEACRHCHQRGQRIQVEIRERQVALHKSCFACHEGKNCRECHKR
jgi:hypothetical protein